MNYEKSIIFVSKHVSGSRAREIQSETGFSEGSFPFTYLGAPIVEG